MMTPQRILFRIAVRFFEFLTQIQPPKCIDNLNITPLDIDNKKVDIFTIAFNNANIINFKIKLLQKYITDDFCHIVADNSTNAKTRENIRRICAENKVAYISLPKNFLNIIGGSYSHANALNYIYKHIVKKRAPEIFGITDHDLFPTKAISIHKKLQNQPIYGPLRRRDECWYLWSGLCFFKYSFVHGKKVDFMPVTPYKTYLDSGGGNWRSIYSKMNLNELWFTPEHLEPLRSGGSRHGDSIEFFDDCWLHTINGSYWKKVDDKEDLIAKILNQLLEK